MVLVVYFSMLKMGQIFLGYFFFLPNLMRFVFFNRFLQKGRILPLVSNEAFC